MSTSSHANETGLLKTICGIQTHVEFANTKANLERMVLWLEHQDVQNAFLVVFPECMLSGYCFASLEEARPHAESIPGPATDAITRVCKSRNMLVVFGLLELGPQDSIYNSCVLVGPTGVISTYRKVHLPYLGVDRFTTQGENLYRAANADSMRTHRVKQLLFCKSWIGFTG